MVWTSGATTYFVDMNTFEPTGVKFQYGALDANGIFQTLGDADKGTFTPDGTIKITVAGSKVGSPAAGDELTAVNADSVLLVGGAGTGLLANIDTTDEGTYTLRECGTTGTAPDAVNDTAITPEGAPTTINVLGNDTHPQGDALTVRLGDRPVARHSRGQRERDDHVHARRGVLGNRLVQLHGARSGRGDGHRGRLRDDRAALPDRRRSLTTWSRAPTAGPRSPSSNESPASLTWAVREDPTTTNLMNHSWHSDATTLLAKDDRLVMPAQDLTGASQLTFWHRYAFEEGFDGGVLEVSTDGGAVWKDIIETDATFDAGGYTGTISTEYESPIGGQSAWTGGPLDAALAPMTQVRVNVGALAGPDVLFRFRLVTDPLERRCGDRRRLVDRRRHGHQDRARLPAAAERAAGCGATMPRPRTRTPPSRSTSSRTTAIRTTIR